MKTHQPCVLRHQVSNVKVNKTWHLTPLSPLFQLYHGGQFYWWWNPEYQRKTTDLPQITDKHHHIMLYRVHLAMSWIPTHNIGGEIH